MYCWYNADELLCSILSFTPMLRFLCTGDATGQAALLILSPGVNSPKSNSPKSASDSTGPELNSSFAPASELAQPTGYQAAAISQPVALSPVPAAVTSANPASPSAAPLADSAVYPLGICDR